MHPVFLVFCSTTDREKRTEGVGGRGEAKDGRERRFAMKRRHIGEEWGRMVEGSTQIRKETGLRGVAKADP